MKLTQIHKSFVSGRFSLFLTLLIFIGLRIYVTNDWSSGALWIVMALQVTIALFLLYLTQAFVIIRQRTFLPAFFYLLFMGTNPLFFYDIRGSVVALIVTFCLFILLQTYQEPKSQKKSLNISLLLTLGSFYWPPLLLLFPLFWFGMYRLKSLNVRVFFASLVGFFVVYLFIYTWSFYKNDTNLFLNSLPDLDAFWTIHPYSFSLKEWVISGFLAFLFIITGLRIFMTGMAEKIRTMTILSYLYAFTFIVFVLLLVQSEWRKEWVLILFVPFSFLVAHFFTLSHRKPAICFFIFTILFFVGIFVSEYWFGWSVLE